MPNGSPLLLASFFLLLAGALAAYFGVGRSGPVYERRHGVLTWPDCLWTVPLALTLAFFAAQKWTFALRYTSLFYLALSSFVVCLLMALAYWQFSKWTRHVPLHMRPLMYARLQASLYRTLVRTALWQGLLAAALDASPVHPPWAFAVPGFLYLLVALPFLDLTRRRAWTRMRYGKTCYNDERRGFDVFVSYKSERADAARRFADLAVANGLKPWFAEYLIRFHSRDKFQQAIDHGIATSRTAILFTGHGYFDSLHCLTELRQLVEKQGSAGILEVGSPGEPRIADWCDAWERDRSLQEGEATRWAAGRLEDLRRIPQVAACDGEGLLEAVRQALRLNIQDRFAPLPPAEPETRFKGEHTGLPFSFRTVGGQEVAVAGSRGVLNPDLKITPRFQVQTACGPLSWEVVLGPVVRRVVDPLFEEIPPSEDDNRWLYNEYRDIAMLWLAENAAECHGVHLFRMAPGTPRADLLLTHWGERQWHRRYAIMMEHDALEKPATFSFAFYFRGTIGDYCRHTPLMDSVVRSLRWENRR